MLTWSLACTFSPASRAITSLAFIFVEVPEPVWNTSIGNCASCLPAAISRDARSILPARALSSRPSSPLTAADAPFTRASQRITDTGTVSPEIGKFSTALAVSPPHNCCLLTGIRSPCRGPRQNTDSASRGSGRGLSAERDQLARQADRVVVGHQKPRALKHPQLTVRQQPQRLFGGPKRVQPDGKSG